MSTPAVPAGEEEFHRHGPRRGCSGVAHHELAALDSRHLEQSHESTLPAAQCGPVGGAMRTLLAAQSRSGGHAKAALAAGRPWSQAQSCTLPTSWPARRRSQNVVMMWGKRLAL